MGFFGRDVGEALSLEKSQTWQRPSFNFLLKSLRQVCHGRVCVFRGWDRGMRLQVDKLAALVLHFDGSLGGRLVKKVGLVGLACSRSADLSVRAGFRSRWSASRTSFRTLGGLCGAELGPRQAKPGNAGFEVTCA